MQLIGEEGENKEFFDRDLRTWSQRKLRILEQYVDSWAKIRGSTNSRLFYVDGFAGRGIFGPVDDPQEGSPLRIAKLAQKFAEQDRKYRLHCLNSELDPVRCANLKQVLSFADPKLVKIYCGAFSSHLPTMLDQMGRCPAIFFLDPCGLIGIEPEEVRPVATRQDTEILLTFSLPTVYRLSGSTRSLAPEANGKVARLCTLLGEDPANPFPEWAQVRQQMSADKWADWVVHRYIRRIHRMSPHLKYALAYPIREKMNSGIKYFLIFATRSMRAFPLMTDFICSEEDDLQLTAEMEARQPGQMSLFAPLHVTSREEKFPAVIEEIHQYGLDHQGCTRQEIMEQVAFQHLGQFKQSHVRYMVKQLVGTGRAQIYDGPDKHKDSDKRPITFF